MRRRDLLRGMFVVAVCSPAIGSAIAKAAAPKPRAPRRRPSSAMPMPPEGFPRVQFRKIGSRRYEIILSNPHDHFIYVQCGIQAIVHGQRLALHLRALKHAHYDAIFDAMTGGGIHSWCETFSHHDDEVELVARMDDGTPLFALVKYRHDESQETYAAFEVLLHGRRQDRSTSACASS